MFHHKQETNMAYQYGSFTNSSGSLGYTPPGTTSKTTTTKPLLTPISSKYTPLSSTNLLSGLKSPSLATTTINNMGSKATYPGSTNTTTPMTLPKSQTQPTYPGIIGNNYKAPSASATKYPGILNTPSKISPSSLGANSGYQSPSSLNYTPPSGLPNYMTGSTQQPANTTPTSTPTNTQNNTNKPGVLSAIGGGVSNFTNTNNTANAAGIPQSNTSQNFNGGTLTPEQIAAGNTFTNQVNNTSTTNPAQSNTQSSPTSNATVGGNNIIPPNSGLYGQLIQQALNAQNQSQKFTQALGQGETDITKQPIPLEFQQGQQSAMQRDYGIQQQALANKAGYLSNLAGLAAPQMQFGQLTDPLTGLPVGGGSYGGNQQLQNAVQQAAQLIRNGASPNDPNVTSLISTFGMPGQVALTQALQQSTGGNYNPTALAGAVQQNVTQGQTYQGQATALQVPLAGLTSITPQVTSLLQQAQLNPTNIPLLNQSINTYKAQADPAAKASLTAAMAEIQNYTSQILGSSGDLTPTQVTALTSSFDPGNFNQTQLTQFLSAIANYGQARLQPLQQISQGSYGGIGAFSGPTANPNPTSPIMSSGFSQQGLTGLNPSTATQAGVGTAMTALGTVENLMTQGGALLGNIFGAITGI